MSSRPKPCGQLSPYDKADEYLGKQRLEFAQLNAAKEDAYQRIESGTHYLKACHEALQRVEP